MAMVPLEVINITNYGRANLIFVQVINVTYAAQVKISLRDMKNISLIMIILILILRENLRYLN